MYRRVILTDLPPNFATRDVVSLVYGGTLENIEFTPRETSAAVTFVDPRESFRYDELAASGIEFSNHLVRVCLDKTDASAEPVSRQIQIHLDHGASRCVRATGPKNDLTVGAQLRLARENGRLVEHTSLGKNAYGVSTDTRPHT